MRDAPLLPLIEWRADVPPTASEQGLHESLGRGGYLIMVRAPRDTEGAEAGARGGGEASHAARRFKRDERPEDWMDRIEALFFSELGGVDVGRTLHAIGMALIGKEGDIVAGTAIEEACWRCVRAKSLRWGVVAGQHIVFRAWRAGIALHEEPT